MGSKTRLSSYCTKRGDNTVNLVTSRKTNARLARPIAGRHNVLNSLSQENTQSQESQKTQSFAITHGFIS